MKVKVTLELEFTVEASDMADEEGGTLTGPDYLKGVKEDFEENYSDALANYEPELVKTTVTEG
jgi:hypothetical protein